MAEAYAAEFGDELSRKPLDRALLHILVDEVGAGGSIADVGCGPGHVAAWLAAAGATPVGVDLSPGMIAVAEREHPGIDFRVGDQLSLPAEDGEFSAAVCLYSIIHLAPGELAGAFLELHRVLQAGAPLLVSFHAGDEVRHVTDFLGHRVEVDFHFFEVDEVASAISSGGFDVEARIERRAYPGEVDTRRAYIMGRRRG